MNMSCLGPKLHVEISDTQDHLRVDPAALADLVRATLALEGVAEASISLALVDDATIHAINRRHLDHDWPTDVITFPLSAPEDAELAGELVVSAETARAVAARTGADPAAELALYVVHGLLHLRGHDDHGPAQTAAMRRREAEVLRVVSLAGHVAEGRGGGPCPR